MSDLSGYDAAYPPGSPPHDQVVFGYLGGNTPHVWTKTEWSSQPARYRVGIWTRSNPVGATQGAAEGKAALAAWRALGAPAGTLIGLDLEMAVNAAYVNAFDAAVVAGGCKVVAYGSKSTVFKNPRPSGGYWVADLTNKPHVVAGSTITQYEFESGWDDDEIAASAVSMLWDTQGGDVALTTQEIQSVAQATVNLLLNTQLPREGAGQSGTVTPGALAEWADAGVQGTRDMITKLAGQVTALQTQVSKITAPTVTVDQATLTAAFTAALTAVLPKMGVSIKS